MSLTENALYPMRNIPCAMPSLPSLFIIVILVGGLDCLARGSRLYECQAVNFRESITWFPFREDPVRGSYVPGTGRPEHRRLNLTRRPRQDDRVRKCMIGSKERVEEHD